MSEMLFVGLSNIQNKYLWSIKNIITYDVFKNASLVMQ